ncbi:adhesion G-protein coupled receptor G2 [Strongylocentrotus purpuratus]|uniref:Uncharacterized protein n=1 Tax=Strongylocentrotus purpuratus TaxID=7668 RepID=A0A7M7LVM6_STRPU|nr:adhesion G-protein coupled receptor G2 [Strongylocentrotus purpuratus]
MPLKMSSFKHCVFFLVCLFLFIGDTDAWRRRRRRRAPPPPPPPQVAPVVVDTTAPTFTYCPNDIGVFYTSTTSSFVSWTTPTATDDTDSSITVETSGGLPGSLFPEGNHTVIYTARDGAGNTAECVVIFTVSVLRCPVLTPPVHGRIVGSCSRLKDSRCEFECEQGYNLTHNAPQCVVTVPNASWDGPTPFCSSSQCGADEVLLPDGQTVVFNQTQVGKRANTPIVCVTNIGVDRTHNVSRLCSPDDESGAMWSDPIYPQCSMNDSVDSTFSPVANDLSSEDATNQTRSELATFIANPDNIRLDYFASRLLNAIDEATLSPKEIFTLVDMALDINGDTFEEESTQAVSDSILSSVDTFLSRIQSTNSNSNFTYRGENLVVAALKVGRTTFPLTANIEPPSRDADDDFINLSTNGESENTGEGVSSIFFPGEVLDYLPDGNNPVAVSVFVLDSLKLFQPNSSTQDELEESSILVSPVLSVTIEGAKIKNLSDPVVLDFTVNRSLISVGAKPEIIPRCVYWERPTNVSEGAWSQEGCQTGPISSKELITCRCNHLTSFAVLMNIRAAYHSRTLDTISIFGCIASILCLVMTIGFLVGIRSLRRRLPQQIMINLSSALLCLYFAFVVGVDKPSWGLGCTVVAILLHYFTLAAVAWMGVEAFSMYLMFVRVVNSYMPKMLLKSCLVGWGGPLLVVGITVAIDWKAYQNTEYCFMNLGPSFYFAQLFPIALILTINTGVFIMVIYNLTCGRKMASMKESTAATQRAELLRRLQNAIAIGTLLGLSWVSGFMAIGSARFFFNVVFVICTSLQGVFIFLLFCVRLPEVRQQMMLLASRLIRALTCRKSAVSSRGMSTSSTSSRMTSSLPSTVTVSYSAGKSDVML